MVPCFRHRKGMICEQRMWLFANIILIFPTDSELENLPPFSNPSKGVCAVLLLCAGTFFVCLFLCPLVLFPSECVF